MRTYIVTNVLEQKITQSNLLLFDHLHNLSLRFHLEKKTGAIANMITRAQHGLEALFWGLFLFLIPTVLEIIGTLISIFYFFKW
jgi:ABC-type transport system involved in Fe-S cluster assembly fused permease/ATPase subunit